MRAFHNSEEIKQKYLDRVKKHREADELIKGIGWDDGKGCAVGCTLEKYSHEAYEKELGIPRILARLEDVIFENLPDKKAMQWPERFLSAIPVGADLRLVSWKFLYRVVENCVTKFGTPHVAESCGDAIRVLHKIASGGKVDEVEARSAALAAWSAASAARSDERASDAAARDAAALAAWSAASAARSDERSSDAAARDAASAARSAASAARAARAARAAWSAAWSDMASTLEKLLCNAE